VSPIEGKCDNGMLDSGIHTATYDEKGSGTASAVGDCGWMN
jgi:hypothetical protein